MLIDLLARNRERLIARARELAAKGGASLEMPGELAMDVPLFFDQLLQSLSEGAEQAVVEVIHGYGDLCQAIAELARDLDETVTLQDFQLLHPSLISAIARAAGECVRRNEQSLHAQETERTGSLAHELRNKIAAAKGGFQLIASGRSPVGGGLAASVMRSLREMEALIDRALMEVRGDVGLFERRRVRLRQLIEEAEQSGAIEAGVYEVTLSVSPLDEQVYVEADPQILAGAIANLLQNAFKFTKAGGRVTLHTELEQGRVKIEVQDECGGLPAGMAEQLFGAFRQRGRNRDGLGLGLFISRKGVEASGGTLRVRDLPGSGCVFTIDLPVASGEKLDEEPVAQRKNGTQE